MLGLKMFCKMHIRIYIILMLGMAFVSCNEDSKVEKEIANIEVDFVVERFDKSFGTAEPKDLGNLKTTYPFLFSKHTPDSIWINRMQDTLQQQIFSESQKVFNDFKSTTNELRQLFQHLKYYDKTFSTPRVVTVLNTVDHRNKTIVNDTLIIIDLLNYFGKNHEFYQNTQKYISENMTASQIVPDITEKYAKKYIFQSTRKTLLDEMIYFGKLLYFKDVMIPFKSDAEKMGYTEAQINWAEANESSIWSYFIEKELLYSTDNKLPSRFILNAPFSKFYLELDNESPGRLGQYIGWQIVKAYADKTNEDIMSIMQKETDEIFNKAKFKPKK